MAYAVTSMKVGPADVARVSALVREHWNIETWHHVKNASLGEDT
ncbi:hypothetical protein GCM10007147_26970 [Nocardiopsis kunsanensis]|uniref:Transposase n=1 Tax=Nocardiopsis kunsanensis TaxID=141693 RepID=A0A919CIN6_9ACTN|nr:hypothetical protein GCM10007147_26970 [Nocardiopsis kunsanensis]